MIDLLRAGESRLSAVERFNIQFVRKSFDSPAFDRTVRFLQRTLGQKWINASVSNTIEMIGLEKLPVFDRNKSYICVTNHRSFFDMYVVFAYLIAHGLPHRLIFPVRSNFFYDTPLGFIVNGAMSFFAMYPPIFRDPARRDLNSVSLDELVAVVNRPGTFAGFHPEGTRNKTDDAYALLPGKPGVGRLIHGTNAVVVPAFVNGLTNSIPKQILGNITRRGERVIVSFGAPIDFTEERAQAASPDVHRQIAEKTMRVIAALSQEERHARTGA